MRRPRPSLTHCPLKLKLRKIKVEEKKKKVKTATLSVTAKVKARAKKKEGSDDAMEVDDEKAKSESEEKKDEQKSESSKEEKKEDSKEDNKDKAEMSTEERDKDKKEDKKEEEARFEILSNPARVTWQQQFVLSRLPTQRYVPVKDHLWGITMLRDTQPDQPEEFVIKAKTKVGIPGISEDEPEPPQPFEYPS